MLCSAWFCDQILQEDRFVLSLKDSAPFLSLLLKYFKMLSFQMEEIVGKREKGGDPSFPGRKLESGAASYDAKR